ncbi:PPE domain-containing protein [Nocardia australiensis]|uniref:PPE domain-containing protein n=1 Tax=Nocardia australiensis TaxID=2887191 RepID=UPI001D13FF08|nr:PPE domain-containing protein [Nocardia australiensis]
MTAGITGVFWLPRMAEFNSVALNAGAHAIPISAAATAWGGLTAAWVDATTTVVRVMAELGVGMQGVNGIAALARLGGFTGWAEQQSVMAATLGTKAAANATAYTVASLAMPMLPEIIATNGAVVASANPPGALSGALEVAEGAKHAMDIRAALVMETYEAATSATVVTPGEFINPPPIANGAGTATPTPESAQTAFQGGPIDGAISAAGAFINNPAVISAATQVANAAGTVASTGVSAAGNIGASAISAVTSTAPSMGAAAPMSMIGIGGAASAVAAAGTRSAASAPVGLGNNSFKLPEGWGAGGSLGTPAAAPVAEAVNITPQTSTPARPASSSSPLMGNQARNSEDDESDHKTADYLRSDDNFTDGRYTADGVIGGAPGTAK